MHEFLVHFAFLRTSVWLCPVVASYLSQPFEMTGGTGSYTFMAGEIFRHEPYNTKADMYSFAMICYHMLTGARPFTRPRPCERRHAREHRRPAPRVARRAHALLC